MKTTHLFEDSYYFISNKAVAKCFMFGSESDCKRFIGKIDHHLKHLCDILAYGFLHDEFQLIVKLKSREVFEEYYKSKFADQMKDDNFIPESTYIFAQAMANMQSGYAKYFNYKYRRDGGLMKGRYYRELIESEEHLKGRIRDIHSLKEIKNRASIWTYRRKEDGIGMNLGKDDSVRSSKKCYSGGGSKSLLQCFILYDQKDMRGHFLKLPPKSLKFKNQRLKLRNLVSFMLMKQNI